MLELLFTEKKRETKRKTEQNKILWYKNYIRKSVTETTKGNIKVNKLVAKTKWVHLSILRTACKCISLLSLYKSL